MGVRKLAVAVVMLAQLPCARPGSSSYTVRTASGEAITKADAPATVDDLHKAYGQIFQHGNRNAASHLWSTWLIERSIFMPRERFLKVAGGFCAVSGSPVGPSDATRYRMRLPHIDGSGKVTGFMYYCCWPCVCDTQDFIRVDTKTIRTIEGPRQYRVADMPV